MKKSDIIKEAFKSLKKFDSSNEDDLKNAFIDFCSNIGISVPANFNSSPEVPNKSSPAFDTLDFDEISSHFDD